ncbi:septum formation family protein [Microbacterium sp. MPKO10]|uniref:septum formation family protein n=1 Tax=Microbacterium sp. MPKO10 TaxID=2989818 RepID=UPI0022364DA6|nr:septum formation family protein [Microbacterium sp. MPKO10]MCW4459009.1 septum formation family protein [Microbacterium sp. MPKO10]
MTPRDDDEKDTDRPDPETGETDLGADWLLSQLDDTGAYSTIDDETAPPATQEEGRRSLRRRFRRRQHEEAARQESEESEAKTTKAAPEQSRDADDGAPTQAFDVMADRAASDPKPPTPPPAPPANDGGFSWGLTPNAEPDPLVAATDKQKSEPGPEPASADDPAESGAIAEDTPTAAFDPFADHETGAVSPEQAAADAAFAEPGAYDRLYDEATLSALDSEADDEDAADDAEVMGVPVPKSAAAAPALDEPLLPEKVEFPDDAERAEAEALADEVGVPLEETTEGPDLGILDLFGGSKRRGPEPTGQEPTPNESAPSSSATGDETETSARLRALFESTATAPAAIQTPAAAPRSERSAPPAPPDAPARTGGSDGGSRNSRPMLLVGLAVVAVVVLGGLFWVGTLIPGMVSASQPQPSETSTPTPTVSIPAEGTLPPGTYAWDMLRGGECLGDYDSPWAEEFTVVDCEGEHDAQLVSVGTMGDDENAAFPGEDELASQIYLKCSDPSVLDLAAAGEYGDVQVQGSYPVTEEQWNEGERNYYCFVNRSSGDPLTGSLVPAG